MDLLMKLVLMGESSVGKTALVERFIRNSFGGHYKATIGLDISLKKIEFPDKIVRLQVWDVGGQIQFKKLRKKFYHGSQAGVLVFDVTRPQTLKELHKWIDEMFNEIGPHPMIILGNKADLKDLSMDNSEIEEEIKPLIEKLKEYYVGYHQTSAKSGVQVHLAFEELAKYITKDIKSQKTINSDNEDTDDLSEVLLSSIENNRGKLS